jgi:hypothetical protein
MSGTYAAGLKFLLRAWGAAGHIQGYWPGFANGRRLEYLDEPYGFENIADTAVHLGNRRADRASRGKRTALVRGGLVAFGEADRTIERVD